MLCIPKIQTFGREMRDTSVPRTANTIVADEYADPEKETGAVKFTPAHDSNDFEVGRRNGIELINILNDDGTLDENAGDFQDIKRFDAWYKIIEALKAKGLYFKWEDNEMKVPRCQKSKDLIEPIMKPQWWLKMKDGLAPAAIMAVRNDQIKIRQNPPKMIIIRGWRISMTGVCRDDCGGATKLRHYQC